MRFEAGGVSVWIHRELVDALGSEGGEIETALGAWGAARVRLAPE